MIQSNRPFVTTILLVSMLASLGGCLPFAAMKVAKKVSGNDSDTSTTKTTDPSAAKSKDATAAPAAATAPAPATTPATTAK